MPLSLPLLSRLTSVILEQVERFRNLEMQRLVSQAELRALQSQINPHFLFNALNTLYGIIPREASGARKTVLNLAEIFRYFLQSERSFIQLSEELEIVKSVVLPEVNPAVMPVIALLVLLLSSKGSVGLVPPRT